MGCRGLVDRFDAWFICHGTQLLQCKGVIRVWVLPWVWLGYFYWNHRLWMSRMEHSAVGRFWSIRCDIVWWLNPVRAHLYITA